MRGLPLLQLAFSSPLLSFRYKGSILETVKIVANIRLDPVNGQHNLLKVTLETCNEACNWISAQAWEAQTFRQYDLHKLVYHEVRGRFGLTAQVAVRCIAKVADAYKVFKGKRRAFRKHAAQPYDDRIFRIISDDRLSIWTLDGREKVDYRCGAYQRQLLGHRKGESDLMLVRGVFYLACVCDIEEPTKLDVDTFLGIDLGIVNIAVDSDGKTYNGSAIEDNRRKFQHRRHNLQRNGSRAAKRKLKTIAGKQARFQFATNHIISKDIVQTAKRTSRGIALENLKHIRERVTARRSQRSRLSNWGFSQLGLFLAYKATLAGVPVVKIDPRNTSRQCPNPVCGHIEKKNRKSRDLFCCRSCGYSGPADYIAALNIASRARAAVSQPNGEHCLSKLTGHSQPLSAL